MIRRRRRKDPPVEMQMGPMIDMVFLLLVFFMVSARPIKQESDINLGLPGAVPQDEAVEIPDEQRIEIQPNGTVVLNEQPMGAPEDLQLPQLVAHLDRFKKSADAAKASALVTLAPDDVVPHQRVVDVLNACAKANITGVTFADSIQPE
ncbi:biopolymer transporter ExbD [Phragmitibacter flavus]|uniref:Biopolymer transporter ExbD n=1 Tax=Phragmitibacter flavus TaxID=2576071 RepID=A0A5R8KIW0_9BACT|nr:biopolymer transporter ExbD [Phragmitibacter flavus]TLD72190.1 biopolymer transporter ExbD [Phragmitibacter flavus]